MIAHICAAHILLNIHDVMQVSPDSQSYSSDRRLDAKTASNNLGPNPHAVSFQMDPLPPRKSHTARDILDLDDLDLDASDVQSVDDRKLNTRTSQDFDSGYDGAYGPSFPPIKPRWSRDHEPTP